MTCDEVAKIKLFHAHPPVKTKTQFARGIIAQFFQTADTRSMNVRMDWFLSNSE
jgi:hypothetical protein